MVGAAFRPSLGPIGFKILEVLQGNPLTYRGIGT